ncbi:hypothetical protein ElyMa_000713700 [Elysia marginata]|uniref:Uncharacterized protein n=1 Tax=Elysia marginata TaxID=1093978 RepID=A0AAV4GL66_9GAST|nr:hypothetical protein ElyMa_000713700 [Elysia marginata]
MTAVIAFISLRLSGFRSAEDSKLQDSAMAGSVERKKIGQSAEMSHGRNERFLNPILLVVSLLIESLVAALARGGSGACGGGAVCVCVRVLARQVAAVREGVLVILTQKNIFGVLAQRMCRPVRVRDDAPGGKPNLPLTAPMQLPVASTSNQDNAFNSSSSISYRLSDLRNGGIQEFLLSIATSLSSPPSLSLSSPFSSPTALACTVYREAARQRPVSTFQRDMFIMAAVPNSFSGSPAGSDGASGGSAYGNRRKNGRGGNVFGISSRNNNSNTAATTTSSSSNSGASFGASIEAAGLLEMDENDNSYPWGLIHHNELAHMITAGLGKKDRDKTRILIHFTLLTYVIKATHDTATCGRSCVTERRVQPAA